MELQAIFNKLVGKKPTKAKAKKVALVANFGKVSQEKLNQLVAHFGCAKTVKTTKAVQTTKTSKTVVKATKAVKAVMPKMTAKTVKQVMPIAALYKGAKLLRSLGRVVTNSPEMWESELTQLNIQEVEKAAYSCYETFIAYREFLAELSV